MHGVRQRMEWMNTTCNHALYAIVDLYTEYYDALANIVTSEVLERLHWCVHQSA